MSASPPEFQKHPPGTRRQPLPASRFLLREQTIRLSYRTRKAASSWQRVTRPSARDASLLQPQARGVLRRRRLRAPDRSFRFSFRFKMAAAARQEKPCSQQSLKPAERLLLRKTHRGGEGRWEALGHTLSPQRTPRPGPARPPTQPGGNLKSGAAQPPPQEGRVGTPPTKVAPERGAPRQVALKTEESRLHEDPSLGSYRARLSDSHGGAQRRRGLRRREGRRDAVGAGLVCLPCSVVLRGRHLA